MRRDDEDAHEAHTLDLNPPPWAESWSDRSVIAALEPLVVERRRSRLQEVISHRTTDVTLLLDGVRDPHNCAAILRSCDAFGVQEVNAVTAGERFLVARRIAQGAEHWLHVRRHPDSLRAAEDLLSRGFTLLAADPEGELVPEDLGEFRRLCLVLGNEHFGVSDALRERCQGSVRVPMFGFAQSLNVSVTAALLLCRAVAQRAGNLQPPVRDRLYAEALYRTVPRSAEVLRELQRGGRCGPTDPRGPATPARR